jgi:response regulator RpfG family c-di-GMP phosphodiesterase
MTAAPLARVLCVDDEPNVLDGLRRNLRGRFDVVTAVGSSAGLKAIEQEGPFAVIVSDLRMPQMDGIQLLARVRERAPDTVRVLLTGNADLSAAAAAVNEGAVFRFLTKPCPPATLLQAVAAADEQHRLRTAERVLLEQTLLGCVKMMTEALALASPAAFGRATRVRKRAAEIAERMGGVERWKIEMAAMLSQAVGVALPPETLERWQRGAELSERERAMVERLPGLGDRLLAEIPRIEGVRAILAGLSSPFKGGGPAQPLGARILRAVLDADALENAGRTPQEAIELLRGRSGEYDPEVLLAMQACLGSKAAADQIRSVRVAELRVGMVLLEPICTEDGRLLLAHGNELSPGLIERLRNLQEDQAIRQPIRVVERRVDPD